jgi:hypothetical protein
LKRAVRAPPICKYPVGEGANRTTGAVDFAVSVIGPFAHCVVEGMSSRS